MINKFLKKINSLINHDLALLVQWLRSNKITSKTDTSKTEIVIFRPKHKIITKHLNFRISGGKNNLIHKCEIPRSYPTQALRMARTYKLSTDETKQGSWPTSQNMALNPKISFKDNLFFNI